MDENQDRHSGLKCAANFEQVPKCVAGAKRLKTTGVVKYKDSFWKLAKKRKMSTNKLKKVDCGRKRFSN